MSELFHRVLLLPVLLGLLASTLCVWEKCLCTLPPTSALDNVTLAAGKQPQWEDLYHESRQA